MSHYWIVAPILGRDWQDIFLLEYKYTKYILFGPNIDKFRAFSGKYDQLDLGELNLNLLELNLLEKIEQASNLGPPYSRDMSKIVVSW